MPDGGTDLSSNLSSNPYFQNGLTLDLLCWSLISREQANSLFIDLHKEARRVTKSIKVSEIEEVVAQWKKEYTESESRVSLRWPHTVFPPLPEEEPLLES